MLFSIILVSVVSLVVNDLVLADDELVAVSLLYRHGDRTIANTYPNDPYQNTSFWPVPYGELTNVGKRKHYALGKWLRQRYSSFLSQTYLAKEFRITSSNYDRCLMSAAANLAGLYPPQDDQIWTEDLPWQPIPIHTSPNNKDGMLALERPCPKFSVLSDEQRKTKEYQDFLTENKELYAYLAENTGMKVEKLVTANDLYDTLFIENLFNYTLPEWTKSVFPDKLRHQALTHFKFETSTREMAKFRVGLFLDQVLKQFDSCQGESIPKFQVFSAHDTNVFNVLNSLRIPNLELVPYTGMVIFELRKSKEGKRTVRFLYKKNKDAELLKLEGCSNSDCDYNEFKSILKPLSLNEEEWEKECGLKNSRRKKRSYQ